MLLDFNSSSMQINNLSDMLGTIDSTTISLLVCIVLHNGVQQHSLEDSIV